jgi:hypothetical protein
LSGSLLVPSLQRIVILVGSPVVREKGGGLNSPADVLRLTVTTNGTVLPCVTRGGRCMVVVVDRRRVALVAQTMTARMMVTESSMPCGQRIVRNNHSATLALRRRHLPAVSDVEAESRVVVARDFALSKHFRPPRKRSGSFSNSVAPRSRAAAARWRLLCLPSRSLRLERP